MAPYSNALCAGFGGGAGLEATIVEKERVEQKGFAAAVIPADGDETVVPFVAGDVFDSGTVDYEL